MSKVQWRPYVNALTKPRSYRAQVMPKETVDYAGMARLLSAKNPLWSADLVESILRARDEEVLNQLVAGNQVSFENAFTYHLSLAVRLNAVDSRCLRTKALSRSWRTHPKTLLTGRGGRWSSSGSTTMTASGS